MTGHAGRAPHDAGARELLALAGEDEDLARRLLSVLVDMGGPAPLLTEEISLEGGLNHWSRLCEDLGIHLQLCGGIELVRRQAAHASPHLTDVLDAACRQEGRHIRRLRDLIARADPHGLD